MWHTFFFCRGAAAPNGLGIPHYWGFTIALRHATLGRTPLEEGSARRRRLYLTTHNTHKRNIVARGGIRIRNSRKRVAADQFIRPSVHWIGCRCGEIYFDFCCDTVWSCVQVPTIESNILCPSSGWQWPYCFSLKCRYLLTGVHTSIPRTPRCRMQQ
jgi:hypothetical protein